MKSKPVKKQQHWGRGHYYEMGQLKEYVMQTEATIMDRLTYHRNNQAAVPKKLDLEFTFKLSEPEWKALDAIIQRLAAYEDTGLSPNEIPHWIPISKRLPPLSDDNYDSRDYKLSDSFQNHLLETVDKQDKQIAMLTEANKNLEKSYRDVRNGNFAYTRRNATLKKALELACNDKMDCPAIWNKKPPFKQCKNCKSGENFEECWYRYFIQQAQKQEKKQ